MALYLMSVLDDGTGPATPTEEADIDAFRRAVDQVTVHGATVAVEFLPMMPLDTIAKTLDVVRRVGGRVGDHQQPVRHVRLRPFPEGLSPQHPPAVAGERSCAHRVGHSGRRRGDDRHTEIRHRAGARPPASQRGLWGALGAHLAHRSPGASGDLVDFSALMSRPAQGSVRRRPGGW